VFICLHTAATIPHITKDKKNITGTYYGVELYASSSKNTTYKPQPITSQEHHEVFICMQTAITTPHITKA